MKRLKTFGKYLLWLIAFYIFSTILSVAFISTTYNKIEGEIYPSDIINIKVDNAEATFVNGHIQGTVANITDTDAKAKYVKIDLFSKNNNRILSKYIEIDELLSGQTKNFTINFEAENIKTYKISVTDEYENAENVHLINLLDAENEELNNISILLATIILLKYVFL